MANHEIKYLTLSQEDLIQAGLQLQRVQKAAEHQP